MKCCERNMLVVDSRPGEDDTRRRRYRCDECGSRASTMEFPADEFGWFPSDWFNHANNEWLRVRDHVSEDVAEVMDAVFR